MHQDIVNEELNKKKYEKNWDANFEKIDNFQNI